MAIAEHQALKNTMTHKFIVFEGLDGSGTSTQAELLHSYFSSSQHLPTVLTAEPSDGPIGTMIRQTFKHRIHFASSIKHFDEQMAYLFAADRYDHLYNDIDGVTKLRQAGYHVICTRYYFSSYAYHCRGPEDFDLVHALNRRFPEPDLVIYIDVPVATSDSRLKTRAIRDSYENEAKLKIVKSNYDKIFSTYTGQFLKVDGTRSIPEVHDAIVYFVKFISWKQFREKSLNQG